MGFPAASPIEIQTAETRLGIRLPPSYREFLEVSDGWRTTGYFLDRLWPVTEVQRLSDRNAMMVNALMESDEKAEPLTDEAYRAYGPGLHQPPRMKYLNNAIELGNCDSGEIYCLLNPEVGFTDREFEIWHFDLEDLSRRFPSFWEFMQDEHSAFLTTNKPVVPVGQAANKDAAANNLPALVQRLKYTAQKWRSTKAQNPADQWYIEGVADAHEHAAALVSQLQTENILPQHLLNWLDELVVRLEQDVTSMEQQRLQLALNPTSYEGEQGKHERIRFTGLVHGLRKAIGPIRWFHYETA